MKNFTFLCLLLFFLASCKSDSNDVSAAEDVSLGDTISTTATQPPLPPPVISEEKQNVIDDQIKKSPFRDMGCCADKTKREAEKCCCDKVIEAYKKMVASKKKGLRELKEKDPILKDCREMNKKEFDEIDNPPLPPVQSTTGSKIEGI